MKEFSSVDAAFYGFSFFKRAPMTFLGVVILTSVLMLGLFALFLPAYADLFEASLSSTDASAALEATGAFYASVGWYMLLSILIGLMIYGAINRALVFDPPPTDWVLGIKIGGDEIRLLWVLIVITFFLILVAVAGGLIGGVILGILGASGSTGMLILGGAVMYAIILIPMIYLGVKFSPAMAATVGEKQIYIFRAWALTKGKFWPIFFAYLILYVIMIVVYLVVIFALAAAFGLFATGAGDAPIDVDAMRDISLGPAVVVGAIVTAVIYTFVYGAFFGVGAYVYRQLGGGARDAAAFE